MNSGKALLEDYFKNGKATLDIVSFPAGALSTSRIRNFWTLGVADVVSNHMFNFISSAFFYSLMKIFQEWLRKM